MNPIPKNADKDVAARGGLWNAICVAADDILHRFQVQSICEMKGATIRSGTAVPAVATWQLIEALSLLGIILRSESAVADVIHIFGKTGPIDIVEDGVTRYVWAQRTLSGERTSLAGRPDIVVTTSRDSPHPGNALRVIEAKCLRRLGSMVVRSEFGKAHDLRVGTYFIWSFYTPSPNVVAGAHGLGIDLQGLGFDTEWRSDFIRDPDTLISRVAHGQEQARRAGRFLLTLQKATEEVSQKFLGSSL